MWKIQPSEFHTSLRKPLYLVLSLRCQNLLLPCNITKGNKIKKKKRKMEAIYLPRQKNDFPLSFDAVIFSFSRIPFQFLNIFLLLLGSSKSEFVSRKENHWAWIQRRIRPRIYPKYLGLKSLEATFFLLPQSTACLFHNHISVHPICVFLGVCTLRNVAFIQFYLGRI